jgi:hypothetical protein
MGNQLTSAGQPVDAITCLRELPEHAYHSVVHTTRFLKVLGSTFAALPAVHGLHEIRSMLLSVCQKAQTLSLTTCIDRAHDFA